jgi:hypothetical protein
MVELYVKISSIDNVGDSLNNLPEISNRIILERRLIQRGRRKHIRLLMVMDEMEGRWVKRGSRLASNNNNSSNILVCK